MRTRLLISIFCFLNACSSPPPKPSIGEQIRAARLQKGMSQAELAASIQMSQEALSRIEDNLADIMHTKIDTVEAVLNIKLNP
jgi:ribosome-binding protein aMBF1 (putative translation factor)